MGKPKPTGNVTAMKADSDFLGAEDIMGRGYVRVRIVDVLTYPAGHIVAGRAAPKPFAALVLEARKKDKTWQLTKKRWIVSSAEVRRSIIIRAESVHAVHWQGIELDLYTKVCRSPAGGLTWGVRVALTDDELNRDRLSEKMQRAADRTTEERMPSTKKEKETS